MDHHMPKEIGIKALWLKRQGGRYDDKAIPKFETITTIADLKDEINAF